MNQGKNAAKGEYYTQFSEARRSNFSPKVDYFGSNKGEENWSMQNPHSCFSFFTLESKRLGLIPEKTKLLNLKGALQEAWHISNTNFEDTKQLK